MVSEPDDFTPWIGVDLDGTLAFYDTWKKWDHIGRPIPKMVRRVQEWLQRGIEVRIFTARVGFDTDVCKISGEPFTKEMMQMVIAAYTKEHIGVPLKATATKDFAMRELWDDRAVQVIPNTGETLSDSLQAEMMALRGKP